MFATTSSDIKTDFLVETLGIPRNNVFFSGDAKFHDDLLRETDGHGADIVLNSLSGQLMSTSWDCVADYGRMIDVGNRDSSRGGSTGLDLFEKNRTFFSVDISTFSSKRQNL